MKPHEQLVQIVDHAVADAVRRSGTWLACHPGCFHCCVGVFPISQLDAARLRDGLAQTDPEIATRIRTRTQASIDRLTPWFPGDATTGILSDSDEAVELFEEYANDEVCPALDPVTGTCDLYTSRPILCRTFGPPMPAADGNLAVCELCFIDATEEQTEPCAIDPSFVALEEKMEEEQAQNGGRQGSTLVAFALAAEAASI